MVLDMSPFCEGEGPAREDARYELFSVIIHSGSTHSGHYTAYIRDVDSLGHWVYPVSCGGQWEIQTVIELAHVKTGPKVQGDCLFPT